MPKQKIIPLAEGDAALIIHTNVDGFGSYDIEITSNFTEKTVTPDELVFYTLLLRGMVYYTINDVDVLVTGGAKDMQHNYTEKETMH
tara:strand:+ start:202 stop:462 length:261 start_codon:yes stop_codon:yes gene_type:complete